jgi:hypothetical protein
MGLRRTHARCVCRAAHGSDVANRDQELPRALPAGYIGDIEQATVNITLASLEALAVGLHCAPADLLIRIHTARSTDDE